MEGETVRLEISPRPDIALLQWWREGGGPAPLSDGYEFVITYCDKGDEGWYFFNASYPDCNSNTDSVYIAIRRNPTPPPCNPSHNKVDFSHLPEVEATSVEWEANAIGGKRLTLTGPFRYPDFTIEFNRFWKDKEPEDGEYELGNVTSLNDFDPYTVYVRSLYTGIIFEGNNGGKIYITHENGKLVATFCDISLSGSNGHMLFTTTARGAIKAP